MSILFLVLRNVCEELLCDLVLTQLVIHCDHQPLGLGIHVANLHSPLVVEKHMVALARGINTHIKLLLLSVEGKYKGTQTELAFPHIYKRLTNCSLTVLKNTQVPKQSNLKLSRNPPTHHMHTNLNT